MITSTGPTAAAGIVKGFLDYAVVQGADRAGLLAAAGLVGVDLSDQGQVQQAAPPPATCSGTAWWSTTTCRCTTKAP